MQHNSTLEAYISFYRLRITYLPSGVVCQETKQTDFM